jgi:hypothetical protein
VTRAELPVRGRVARELSARYTAGESMPELAGSLGCSLLLVSRLLAEAGTPIRPRTEAAQLSRRRREREAELQAAADGATESAAAE